MKWQNYFSVDTSKIEDGQITIFGDSSKKDLLPMDKFGMHTCILVDDITLDIQIWSKSQKIWSIV